MSDAIPVQRTALGAASVIVDDRGRVLLVHHTYGRFNWELPGGAAEPGEGPDETARREVFEETGLRVDLDRLTGVYYEPGHDLGTMLHFVFRGVWNERLTPVPSSHEISELGYWPLDDLPTPISDFTERRIRDALAEGPVRVGRVARRTWRE
jgi:8-oxo-dGTP pyrophosphatase MutT (NUDIX family)